MNNLAHPLLKKLINFIKEFSLIIQFSKSLRKWNNKSTKKISKKVQTRPLETEALTILIWTMMILIRSIRSTKTKQSQMTKYREIFQKT